MADIPPAKQTDAEDVVWGLQTAEALWKRGEKNDAIVWLRRAAQAAGNAADDDRALELARFAAELTDEAASEPPRLELRPTVDAMEEAIDVDLGSSDDHAIAREAQLPAAPEDPRPPPHRPPSQPTMEMDAPPRMEAPPASVGDQARVPSVPPGALVHAGILNPWDERPSSPQPKSEEIPRERISEEILTSVRPPPPRAAAPRAPGQPPPLPQRARAPKPVSPSKAAEDLPVPAAIAPPAALASLAPPSIAEIAPVSEPTAVRPVTTATLAWSTVGSSPNLRAAVSDLPPAPPAPESEAPVAMRAPPTIDRTVTPLDLESAEAFADLPDDARTAFAAAATQHRLAAGEEASGFALAYVVRGVFDVAATMVDAPAARIATSAVLRARGTTEEGVPMRLICAEGDGVVATWTDAAVSDAFRTCPWVEEDLRSAADRLQALVGITIGPLGERLDVSIREEIVGRLTMRPLLPGEVVVEAGAAVPGLLLVGVGELELVSGNVVVGQVGSGDFLFPGEVLGAGSAPHTARAGTGGALILFGDRGIAQELLVTCPPLLEVFAGM